MNLDQILAIIRGAATTITVIKGLIKAGRGPANPDGTPLTAEDVDRHYDAAIAEVLAAGDEAQARIDRRTGGG